MADRKKEKISLVSYDPVESPEEIIAADKNKARREAFQKAYKVIVNIIPGYFLELRKRNNKASGGGTSFTQSIVVTPEKVTLETKETQEKGELQEEKERED